VAISRAEVQSRLQPYLLTHLDKQVLDLLTNDEFVDVFNDVANDLNETAQLNQERYLETGSDTTAEDDGFTNFLLAGDISRIYSFKFEGSGWRTQKYSYTEDRIVLKDSAEGIVLDIKYLRKCEDVDVVADEIDLPSSVLMDYVELLRVKFRMDYGNYPAGSYEAALQTYVAIKAQQNVPNMYSGSGIRRNWFQQTGDDNVYEIIDQWISMDNFVADVNGIYTYIS
jgi:hypothetical protein